MKRARADMRDVTGMPPSGDTTETSGSASWSVSDVAARLDVSDRTVRRYIRDGTLPAARHFGRHGLEYRVTDVAVTQFEARRQATRDQPVARAASPADAAADADPTTTEYLLAALERMDHLAEMLSGLHQRVERMTNQSERLLDRVEAVERSRNGEQGISGTEAPVKPHRRARPGEKPS